MNELEKFLQQAAQRMQERQQAAQQQARSQAPQMRQPSLTQQPPLAQQSSAKQSVNRPALRREQAASTSYEDDIVEAEIVDLIPVEQGPNRLSKLDTRAKPGTANVSLADERLVEHLHQTFDHSVGKLAKATSQAPVSTVVANEQTNRKIEVETQRQDIHWVTKLLQDPESLRSAFIASEIFKQRF